MPSDWTKSETISAPDEITIEWLEDTFQPNVKTERSQLLISTTRSTSTTQYETISYKDADGNIKQEDVAVYKEDIKWATKAAANQRYVSMRLKLNLGLPDGGDQERSVTTYEYKTSTEGPVLVKETTEVYMSYLAFMGQLQGFDYYWSDPESVYAPGNPLSQYIHFDPPEREVLNHRTVIEHETVPISTDPSSPLRGREVTRTKTSRWTALGSTSEGKDPFGRLFQEFKKRGWITEQFVIRTVDRRTKLKFEGTEVQTSIGRAPVPTRPSDAELKADEVVNGQKDTSETDLNEKYGNDLGWTRYVPPGTDPKTLLEDRNNDGKPDWTDLIPKQWEDHNTDSNNDGVPDWAAYIPPDENWQDYVTDPQDWQNTPIDSNNDGVPDWADKTPIGEDDFDTKASDYLNPEPKVNNDHTITGRVVFDEQDYDDNSLTVTATYDMPFAPDDRFEFVKSIRKLTSGGARESADRFGKTEAALDIGHAYGQNIVTGFNEIPTIDLAPVYVQLAGIEVAFLTDSLSYAWGPEGMVVSSDLMLVGVTGYTGSTPPANSWIRLPVPATSIAQASGTTIEGSPAKANSIAIPSGFNIRNPGAVLASLPTNGADVFAEWKSNASLVPPSLVLELLTIESGPAVELVEFEYPLTLDTETFAIESGPAVDFVWVTTVAVPAAAIVAAPAAPIISTGRRVVVPAAGVAVAAAAPAISTGAAIQVPAAGAVVAAAAPDYAGRQRTIVSVPAAGIAVATLAPQVVTGTAVLVPPAVIAVEAKAPDEVGIEKANYWSAWSQQLYGIDRDWSVDWWAD